MVDTARVGKASSGGAMTTATSVVLRPFPDEPLVQVDCPLCGTDETRFLMHGRDRLFGRPGWYRLVQCAVCEMKYVNPRPSVEALSRHYPDDYLPVRLPEDGASTMGRRLGSALIDLRWFGYIRAVERITGPISSSAGVVDVGCGLNEFLVRLERLRGCRGLAVDVNPGVARYIRTRLGMPVVEGTLPQAQVESGTMDLVTMNEYLEHEPDPLSVLLEARRISRSGAHLVVEVPYMGGLPSRVFGSCWSQLDVPRHLAFYTPETLEKMLKRAGYRLVHTKPFGVPFSIGISVLQSLGFRKLGRLSPLDALLIALAGAPFLPLFPWLHELMLVVARAE